MGDVANPVSVRRKRRRQPINLALVLLCAALCLCAGLFEKPGQTSRDAAIIRTAPDTSEAASYLHAVDDPFYPRRPVYPYSVIPGGALNRAELARAIDRDPVVARHYSGFLTRDARLVRVQDEKLVHVSYQMDNKVFWSTRKIRLARGEALITDGTNLARARCGNRISVLALEPTSPEEPPVETFDFPVVPSQPEAPLFQATLDPGIPPEPFTELPHLSPNLPVLIRPPNAKEWTPPNLPTVVPTAPLRHTVPPSNISEVPEPSTLILLASGLAVAAWLKLRSNR